MRAPSASPHRTNAPSASKTTVHCPGDHGRHKASDTHGVSLKASGKLSCHACMTERCTMATACKSSFRGLCAKWSDATSSTSDSSSINGNACPKCLISSGATATVRLRTASEGNAKRVCSGKLRDSASSCSGTRPGRNRKPCPSCQRTMLRCWVLMSENGTERSQAGSWTSLPS